MSADNKFRPDRIIGVREAKGWKQADLARSSAQSESDVSRYERGLRKRPSAGVLKAFADALEVDLDYFLDPSKYEGFSFRTATALMTLDRYTSSVMLDSVEVAALRDVATTHSNPPVSVSEWERLDQALGACPSNRFSRNRARKALGKSRVSSAKTADFGVTRTRS